MSTFHPPGQRSAARRIGFIGGGNMASAIMGGLIDKGTAPADLHVVEPFEGAREQLRRQLGVAAAPAAGPDLQDCGTVVWAVKPQAFKEAAQPVAPLAQGALHISVAAGIRTESIARWLGSGRVARAMPNTPALIGKGMTGLFATPEVSEEDRRHVETVLGPTGELLWLEREEQLDAVTALSGSGPAYVFFFLEAMVKAGSEMGLSEAQARQMAVATFGGAAALAHGSQDPLESMRQRVTSKGGTTHAAISSMEQDGVQAAFVRALHAAQHRAGELGDEFGRD